METTSNLLQQRREKADSLAEAGVKLFSNTFRAPTPDRRYPAAGRERWRGVPRRESGTTYRVAGRVMSMRKFGKAAFFHLQDETDRHADLCPAAICWARRPFDHFKKWDVGDIVGVEGRLFKTKTGELSIEAARLQMITKSCARCRKNSTASPTSKPATASATSI